MKRWSLIAGNVVVNTVESESLPSDGGAWVETPPNISPGWRLIDDEWLPPAPLPASTRLTKRAFWSRFPIENFTAMQAILRSGSPAILAGRLGVLQALVSDSPFVDLALPQTVLALEGLASEAYPETITIDSYTLPLRLTQAEKALILSAPVGEESYRGGLNVLHHPLQKSLCW